MFFFLAIETLFFTLTYEFLPPILSELCFDTNIESPVCFLVNFVLFYMFEWSILVFFIFVQTTFLIKFILR